MNACAVAAGRDRRLPFPRRPDLSQCIRGILAVLAALAVLATPVQCSLAMGAHSLFVDPRDMMAMATDHAGHMGHMGHMGHAGHADQADHTDAATDTLAHQEQKSQVAPSPASILPQVLTTPNAAIGAGSAQDASQPSQVNVPTLRQLSGFVDATSPVAIGGPTLALSRRWSPALAPSPTEDALQPVVSWTESPPP